MTRLRKPLDQRKPWELRRLRGQRATPRELELARIGLAELREHRLHVVLVPAPQPKHRGHRVRSVESRNPEWFSAMRAARAGEPSIRADVLRALAEILRTGYVAPTPYSLARETLDALEQAHGYEIGPPEENLSDPDASEPRI